MRTNKTHHHTFTLLEYIINELVSKIFIEVSIMSCNWNDVAGTGRNSRRCDFVFDCLEDLLDDRKENKCEDDHEENRRRGDRNSRRCDFVFDCLRDLLEDASDDNGDGCDCRCRCRCCRCRW